MSTPLSIPIIAAITALAAIPCAAQSASIAVTHNHPTGLLQPGETVRLTYKLQWTGAFSAAHIKGDAAASPNLGVSSNPTGAFGHWATVPSFGQPQAGSVMGVDLRVQAPYIMFPTAYSNPFGVDFLSYDWTAPSTPGTIDFNWTPDPAFPTPLFYLTFMTEVRSPLPTTYLGTSITVVPAPAPVALLLLSAVALSPRRRR